MAAPMRRYQVIVPIVTPYDGGGGIDASALEAHAAALVEAGADGFFVCGTTGEGPLLTDDEVVRATAAVARGASGRRVITQAGRPSTDASCTLVERAIEAGADGLAAITPYFYDLGRDEAIAHYERLLEASGTVPLHAYVIPQYARNDLPPAVVGALAAQGLAGVKDSTKSLERHAEYVAAGADAVGGRFEALVGDDALALAALRLGSGGVVPALANVRPELFRELVAAAGEGRDADAEAMQAEIDTARAALRDGGIATLKQAVAGMMHHRGVAYGEATRGPLPRPRDRTPPS